MFILTKLIGYLTDNFKETIITFVGAKIGVNHLVISIILLAI